MTRKKVSEGLALVTLSAPWYPIPVILSVAKNLERMAWSLRFFAFVSAQNDRNTTLSFRRTESTQCLIPLRFAQDDKVDPPTRPLSEWW
jgi:hypothetical protein